MRHFLILASLAFVTASYAEEADFDFNGLIAKKALRDYKKAVAKDEKATELKRKELDKEAANLAKSTRDAFVENLTKALKQSMQAGNLDEANKINAAIKTLEQGASPAGASVAGSKGKKKAKKSKARIPRDAVKWNGHHYKLFKTAVTHPVALRECKNKGGHLVRIENAYENKFVNRLVVTQMVPPRAFFDGWVYIDGTDSAKEDSWIYSDGTPAPYLNWKPGEPHNDPRYDEDCLTMEPTTAGFGDVVPGIELWYVCEWDE